VAYYATTNTLIQVLVSPRLRGRVLSLHILTSPGLILHGNLMAGAIAQRFDARLVLTGDETVTLILLAIAAESVGRESQTAGHQRLEAHRGGLRIGRPRPSDSGRRPHQRGARLASGTIRLDVPSGRLGRGEGWNWPNGSNQTKAAARAPRTMPSGRGEPATDHANSWRQRIETNHSAETAVRRSMSQE
jgi:hypothetical protein